MSPDRRSFLLAGGATVAGLLTPDAATADAADDAKKFIAEHEQNVRPLEIAAALAWWQANITGKDEDFKKKEEAQNAIDAALSNKETFAKLKAVKEARDKGQLKEPLLARQIDLLYLAYLEKQVEPSLLKQITAKANAVEQQFNVYRANVDGKEMTDSEVRNVLKTSTDSGIRQKVWEASKGVGQAVAADLHELVALRNEAAKKLGFANFHAMMLTLSEQKGDELIKLFDDLDQLTKEPFTKAKAEIDERLAKRYGVQPSDLMPWHYHDPFFQESPAVFEANLDAPYQRADLIKLCQDFYKSIGLPIDDVIARSDLYEKKGKSPHAFCTDIDREGDVRVLANVVNNEYWMGTMLHEVGHSVYSSKNIPRSMPYVLRDAAHIRTTEGVAMQFERFSKSRRWLEKMGVTVMQADAFEDAAVRTQRNQLLIFSRWCQVMLRFEKSMYENPKQDLNKLWWDLVEQYQQVKRPKGRNAPDYASKIHIGSAPVYYHNDRMGQRFASQVHHTIARELYNNAEPRSVIYIGDKKVGDFMQNKVFEPGRSLDWKGLTKHATGEDLNPKAFAKDFQAS
jgi:peptidyl-dipeptidase A